MRLRPLVIVPRCSWAARWYRIVRRVHEQGPGISLAGYKVDGSHPAEEWLEGGLSQGSMALTYRAWCPSSKEYNHLPRGYAWGF